MLMLCFLSVGMCSKIFVVILKMSTKLIKLSGANIPNNCRRISGADAIFKYHRSKCLILR